MCASVRRHNTIQALARLVRLGQDRGRVLEAEVPEEGLQVADVVEAVRRTHHHLQPVHDRVAQMQVRPRVHHVHLGVLMTMMTPSCTMYQIELQ